MANNALFFNAALSGFIGGAQSGRVLTDAVSGDYAGLTAAAVAYATKLDSLIVTGSPTASQASLIASISRSVISGRYTTDTVQADYSVVAAAVVALYTNAAAQLQ